MVASNSASFTNWFEKKNPSTGKPSPNKMNKLSMIVVFCVLFAAVVARPQGTLFDPAVPLGGGAFAFPGVNFGSGTAAGAGSGNAGPAGVSSMGVAITSAQNGGSAASTGTGTASLNVLTGQAAATGSGSGVSSGKK